MHERTRVNIQSLLNKRGLSARQLAIAIRLKPGFEKLQPTTITRFMNGFTADVHYGLLSAIAEELGTTVDGLTGQSPIYCTDARTVSVIKAMENLPDFEKEILVNTASALSKKNQQGNQ